MIGWPCIAPWLISNLMHKILIYSHIIHSLKPSKCFEHCPAHLQEVYVVTVYMQPLVSSLSAGDCLVHRLTGAQDLIFSKNVLRTPDLAWFLVGNEFLNSRYFSMHNLWRERFGPTVKNVGAQVWGVEDKHSYERLVKIASLRNRELLNTKQELEPHILCGMCSPFKASHLNTVR
jgi:hypothetical protein